MINIYGTRYHFHPFFIFIIFTSILAGNVGELLTLFSIVFIHEMGHVVAAKFFGWDVKSVQLLPFGGVAEVETHRNTSAKEEIIVAIAGPFQNFWMIGIVFFLQKIEIVDPIWSSYFIEANLMIALFNLLPILPLDGGKIVQAMLSFKLSFHRSLKYCGWHSFIMSLLLIGYACMHMISSGVHLNLMMIGIFLLYTNWYYLRNSPFYFIKFLMRREFTFSLRKTKPSIKPITAQPSSSLSEIVKSFKRDQLHVIYVINDFGKIQAMIPEEQIIKTYLSNPNSKNRK
ncbi:M50 family metallopeptidase [Chengkuizengella axinellae]|uniref:M50 family metallopeptidase n=1 Tax=Chengkuizengella axinellae TaxID=3064388 RepID=A0ABT9ITQ7_9BACL|nr:M50 family metallopeptidase [Chengkuizengella sp. 2205SS18-9]MDP5272734.1 M50 family metallopeptidase [Chengkuizengella sp. 2205SS18-9]